VRIAADASAILAILFGEPEADEFLNQMLLANSVCVSPVNWWEVQVRMQSVYGDTGHVRAERWAEQVGIRIEPITMEHTQVAIAAWSKYHGRPARFNMGDCFAYALATSGNLPLLYKGKDFSRTDVRVLGH
jgi:ribonuclease VapC